MRSLWVVMLGLVLLAAAWAEEPAKPEDKDKPIPVEKLIAVFNENEARAELEFVDKPVQVIGEVFRVERNVRAGFFPTPDSEYFAITLSRVRGDSFGFGPGPVPVKCLFPRDQVETLAKLSRGQVLVVSGVCQGRRLRQDLRFLDAGLPPRVERADAIELKDCKIVRVEDAPVRRPAPN